MTREIRLPAPHPRFRPRIEGDLRRHSHPGTTVRIGEDLYEIVAAERTGPEWVYRLEPWMDEETIRSSVEWGEGSAREFAAGLRDDRIRGRKTLLTWGAQALLGFLPAKNQKRIFQARGMDPARATLWSAALETLVSFPFAFLFLLSLFTGGLGASIPAWAGGLAFVVTADGLFRLATVISTGDPIGSLFLAPLGLRLKSEDPGCDLSDEISGIGEELNVVSAVPKAWWIRAGGVTYGGEPYILTGSDRDRTRYIYRFHKGGKDFPALDPEREKARNRSSDLSYVFAPLWGFLPSEMQKTLEFYGRYKPRLSVIISICVNLLAALALIGPGLRSLSRGVFEIWSLVMLAAAIALVIESSLRLMRLLKDGRNTGSFLGFLVKPIYYLTIKDSSPGVGRF